MYCIHIEHNMLSLLAMHWEFHEQHGVRALILCKKCSKETNDKPCASHKKASLSAVQDEEQEDMMKEDLKRRTLVHVGLSLLSVCLRVQYRGCARW